MVFDPVLNTLDAEGLQRFQALNVDAVRAVTDRFYATHGSVYDQFGDSGRQACQDDLSFHLEFLRPVLEFGLLQPMVDYLVWLDSVLVARSVPSEHLALSLDWLGEFFAQAMEGAGGDVVAEALAAARNGLMQTETSTLAPALPVTVCPESLEFEATLLRGNGNEAWAMINRMMDGGFGLVELEMQVIQPALYRIGERWQNNHISVAQEHIATAIVQRVMAAGLVRSLPPVQLDKRVLLACVEGNHHAVGLAMVSDAFVLAGWQVQYLGANVPTSALVARIVSSLPDLVGLSVSFPQQLRMAKLVMVQLREKLGNARPAVMLGGLAINRFSRLADVLGADACSTNAQLAVARADQMVLPN